MNDFRTEDIEVPTAEALADASVTPEVPDATKQVQQAKRALRRAAKLAGALGATLETFMTAAYGAFLEANPEERERLANVQMLEEIESLRSTGRIAQA